MSNSKFYYFKGKCKWFRPNKLSDYNKWEHVLYLDEESLNVFKELKEGTDKIEGLRNKLQYDEDGYHVRISRPSNKNIKGKIVGFSPPIVLDREGIPLRSMNVGNGSDVTTKVEVYNYPIPKGMQQGNKTLGTAMRWESTRIDNLIPFAERTDFTAPEQLQVEGLRDVVPQKEF